MGVMAKILSINNHRVLDIYLYLSQLLIILWFVYRVWEWKNYKHNGMTQMRAHQKKNAPLEYDYSKNRWAQDRFWSFQENIEKLPLCC